MNKQEKKQLMSDFSQWCSDRDTDRLAELGTDAWREAMKLMRSAWDHQDAINDTLRDDNERLKSEAQAHHIDERTSYHHIEELQAEADHHEERLRAVSGFAKALRRDRTKAWNEIERLNARLKVLQDAGFKLGTQFNGKEAIKIVGVGIHEALWNGGK
jgi:Mg2+ and Co2+ transporter CorA